MFLNKLHKIISNKESNNKINLMIRFKNMSLFLKDLNSNHNKDLSNNNKNKLFSNHNHKFSNNNHFSNNHINNSNNLNLNNNYSKYNKM